MNSVITDSLYCIILLNNAKYVLHIQTILQKKRPQKINHIVQLIKAVLNTWNYSIIILVLSCQKNKNTTNDHLKVISQLVNSFCCIQQFTNGNGLETKNSFKETFLVQLQQWLMGHYQSYVTMWYISGPYYSLQCSSDVRLEWMRSLVMLGLWLWGTMIVIVWRAVNKVCQHGSHCLIIFLEKNLRKRREWARGNVTEKKGSE